MPTEIILRQTESGTALLEKREQLLHARTLLATSETELAHLRAQLKAFENRYFNQVGILYAELDEVHARIAEREAERDGSDDARSRAEEARSRAQESHDAAFGEDHESESFDPPADLKKLFRDVARRVHPDFARDEAEREYFTVLMTRANHAYSRGDSEILQRLLDDHLEINASIQGETAAAELLRMTRQIRHAERDIAKLDLERHTLLGTEVAQLHLDAEAASAAHRDLLLELASQVRAQIAEAQRHLQSLAP